MEGKCKYKVCKKGKFLRVQVKGYMDIKSMFHATGKALRYSIVPFCLLGLLMMPVGLSTDSYCITDYAIQEPIIDVAFGLIWKSEINLK